MEPFDGRGSMMQTHYKDGTDDVEFMNSLKEAFYEQAKRLDDPSVAGVSIYKPGSFIPRADGSLSKVTDRGLEKVQRVPKKKQVRRR